MLRLMKSVAVLLLAALSSVAAHGRMDYPRARSGSSPFWFSQGCQPGCERCTDRFSGDTCSAPGGTMAPTLTDTKLRTYMDHKGYDWTATNPWRAPGHSPVFGPCGVAGGGATRHAGNGAVAPKDVPQGFDGRELPETPKSSWKPGSVQEVAWAITANHGGGYAYRLCPKTANLTEECFQGGHLAFAAEQSWIVYGSDWANRSAINATRVKQGTHPAGSEWSKNPIPACSGFSGGVGKGANMLRGACKAPQFPPPLPGLYGYGPAACFGSNCTEAEERYWHEKFAFSIVDSVVVPHDLAPGEYALSFRWDCEQTPQVWAQCADVTITA